MTYEEALRVVTGSYGSGKKRGFGVCAAVLEELGNPHRKLKSIHVAGTNGKGSACVFLREALRRSGYSVGMFTSPHLYRFNERINVDGADILDDEFAEAAEAVNAAFCRAYGYPLSEGGKPGLSYFELLTLMAFYWFYKRRVDIAIIEAGIGGRDDATNILPHPILSVITSVSLDHTAVLGNTAAEIAEHKGGIVKKYCPTVLYYQSEEVYNVIDGICREKRAPMFCAGEERDIQIVRDDLHGLEFCVKIGLNGNNNGVKIAYDNVRLRMAGAYQVYNAVNALVAIHALNELGYGINDKAALDGLYGAKWPGRMEVFGDFPPIVLEGAHNPEGAEAAAVSMRQYFGGRRLVLVAGILKEKDCSTIINLLAKEARHVVLTQPAYSVKATPAAELFRVVRDKEKVCTVTEDFRQAMDTAAELAGKGGAVFVSGSLYLVGDVRHYLLSKGICPV